MPYVTATIRDDDGDQYPVISNNIPGNLAYTRDNRRDSNVREPALSAQFSIKGRTLPNGTVIRFDPRWIPGLIVEVDNNVFSIDNVQRGLGDIVALLYLTDGRPIDNTYCERVGRMPAA